MTSSHCGSPSALDQPLNCRTSPVTSFGWEGVVSPPSSHAHGLYFGNVAANLGQQTPDSIFGPPPPLGGAELPCLGGETPVQTGRMLHGSPGAQQSPFPALEGATTAAELITPQAPVRGLQAERIARSISYYVLFKYPQLSKTYFGSSIFLSVMSPYSGPGKAVERYLQLLHLVLLLQWGCGFINAALNRLAGSHTAALSRQAMEPTSQPCNPGAGHARP